MTIRHLKVYLEVCSHNSITKAGISLNMAQPAVSNVIRELEAYYGVRLFERMNRRLYLTEAGSLLQKHAVAIIAQMDETKEIIQDKEAHAKIRIGSNVAFGTCYLPDILSDFSAQYPEIPVYVNIGNSTLIEQNLLQNKLDFAVIDNFSDLNYFHSQLIFSDQMKILASPGFIEKKRKEGIFTFSSNNNVSVNRSLLPSLPFLLREPGSGSREVIERVLRQVGFSPRIAAESSSTQSLLELCKHGLGLAIIPNSLALSSIESGELLQIHVPGTALTRNYYLLYHNSKYLTKSMKLFIDTISILFKSQCDNPSS